MKHLYHPLCDPGNITEDMIEKLQDTKDEEDCHKIPSTGHAMAVAIMNTQQLHKTDRVRGGGIKVGRGLRTSWEQ